MLSPKLPKSGAYFAFAQKQLNYLLGDTGRSFVVGFGKNPPTAGLKKWTCLDYLNRPYQSNLTTNDFNYREINDNENTKGLGPVRSYEVINVGQSAT